MNSLDKLTRDLQKKYGNGSIMSLKSNTFPYIDRIPVDSPKIADVLGGGIPRGRVIELFGPESTGKSSLACYFAGQVQKFSVQEDGKEIRKGRVAFIDAEHSIDPEYAESFGFNLKEAIFSQPDSGEQALDIAIDLVESKEIDFIVIDSIAALTPKAELEGEMGDMQMGAQARMLGKAMRKITAALSYSKCTLLFVNQVREKIGGWAPAGFTPEVTPGGRAVKFGASIRLEIRKIEFITEKGEILGLRSRLKGVKNKTASPMRKQELEILFGQGFQTDFEWIDFAIQHEVIKQAGAWFTMEGIETKFQGKHSVVTYLKEKEDLYNSIIEETKKRMYPKIVKE